MYLIFSHERTGGFLYLIFLSSFFTVSVRALA